VRNERKKGSGGMYKKGCFISFEASMNIVHRQIAELRFAEYNARTLTKKQAKDLTKSLEGFGVVEPAVINVHPERKDIIIGGHQRIKVARDLGYDEFPCVEVNLPLEREKELNIRLNKNLGDWDWDLLIQGFNASELIEWGFNREDLPLKESQAPVFGDDDLPTAPEKARTKSGDLYELGLHRLYCGDATWKSNLDKLTMDEKARLIFTSPPYNMKAGLYAGYKDNRNNSDFVLFNFQVLMSWKTALAKEGFVFWNMSYNKNSGASFLQVFHQFVTCSDLVFLEDIVWDKGHGMPLSEQLTRQYEHILVLNESPENIHFIDHIGVFGTKRIPFVKRTNKSLTNYWRVDTFKTQTEKLKAGFPVELPLKAIELTTVEGELILDPFGGGGTTLIAAEKSGRRCFTMELDPINCDTIVERYVKYSGNKKVKLNGQECKWDDA